MSNVTLANKWRPKCFAELVGQETVVSVLQRQIATKTFKNCYLFCGSHGCVDKDTEYFNGTKWVPIGDYKDGDKVLQYTASGLAELVSPLEYVKLECDSLYEIKSQYGLDMCISDEHRVIYKTSKGHLHEIRGKELISRMKNGLARSNYKILTHFQYSGKGIDLSDAEIKLMCATICDGTFRKDVDTNWCTLNLKKDRKIAEARAILNECGIHYVETPHSTGYVRFHYQAPCKEKEFNDYWYDCTQHQLEVICDNVLKWDGSVSINRKTFSNTSLKTITFLQFAFSACGYRATIYAYDRVGKKKIYQGKEYTYKSIEYQLAITKRSEITLPSDLHYSIYKPLDGYKYCFRVPSGMWVMRRNGHITITGNCGKTSCARIVASEVNNHEGTPIEIDAASNNGVDNIRQLNAEAQQTSIDSEYKVIIIDECHMMTVQAWNAALKLIEEPPANTIFIFCTTNPEKIPDTILSRVQRFDFRKISKQAIADRLEFILNEETITTYERDALVKIADASNGFMRDAITLLDKCLDFAQDVTLGNVEKVLGVSADEDLFKLFTAIQKKDTNGALKVLDDLQATNSSLGVLDNFLKFLIDAAKIQRTKCVEYGGISDKYKEYFTTLTEDLMPIVERTLKYRQLSNELDSSSIMSILVLELCRR